MSIIKDLTTEQIHKIIAIKKKVEKLERIVSRRIEKLHTKIESVAGVGHLPNPFTATTKKKRRMSKAGRAAIAAGARARWARIKGNGKAKAEKQAKKKDRRSSPATRAKLAAAARARWARAKAEGKKGL